MIIHDSEEKSKENFDDRKKVMQNADKIFRSGDVACPKCQGTLKLHGTYERHVTDGAGEGYDGWIAQGYCGECKKYHSLIPSFIEPYKQYSAEVLERVITEYETTGAIKRSDCPASDSVIYRWIQQFKERGARAVGWLASMAYTMYEEYKSIIEVQEEGVMKQLERLTRRLVSCKTKGIIGRTNIILTKTNQGFV
jgi:transposase-like protein